MPSMYIPVRTTTSLKTSHRTPLIKTTTIVKTDSGKYGGKKKDKYSLELPDYELPDTPDTMDRTTRPLWTTRPRWTTEPPLWKGTNGEMTQAEIEVTKITYPIAADDFCECVTFPDSGDYEFVKCTGDSYWSTFSIYLSDDTCYDITFLDSSEVYGECAYGSDMSPVSDYAICEFDFTDYASEDDAEELEMIETTAATTDAEIKVAPSDETTPSLRQETKKTHVHFTVHRMLVFIAEAVLSLQNPEF